MDPATAALIAGFGGTALGFGGAMKLSYDQRREDLRRDRREALGAYLGALYPVVGELREMPPNKELDALSKAIDKIGGEHAAWVRTRRSLVRVSPHLFGRIDRLSAALARIQMLDMAPEVTSAVDDATDYVDELADDRTPERIDGWPTVHHALLQAARSLGTNPPRPGIRMR